MCWLQLSRCSNEHLSLVDEVAVPRSTHEGACQHTDLPIGTRLRRSVYCVPEEFAPFGVSEVLVDEVLNQLPASSVTASAKCTTSPRRCDGVAAR